MLYFCSLSSSSSSSSEFFGSNSRRDRRMIWTQQEQLQEKEAKMTTKRERLAGELDDTDDESDPSNYSSAKSELGDGDEVENDEEVKEPLETTSQRKRRQISLEQYVQLQNGHNSGGSGGTRANGGDTTRKRVHTRTGDDESVNEGDARSTSLANAIEGSIASMLRTVIARSTTNRPISASLLRPAVKGRMKLNEAIEHLNFELAEVWGLKLQPIDSPKPNGPGKNSGYILVNAMSQAEKDILDQLWIDVDEVHENNHRNSNEEQFFLPKHQRDPLPSDNAELLKTGVTAMILSIIIIEQNHLSRPKLIKCLNKFGLSSNAGNKNSNLDGNILSLLEELERKEYITRAVAQTNDTINGNTNSQRRKKPPDDNTFEFYNLGSRALLEFTPMSFYNFIKEIYGSRFDSSTKDKVLITLQRAFNRTFEEDLGSHPSLTNEPDMPNMAKDERQSPDLPI